MATSKELQSTAQSLIGNQRVVSLKDLYWIKLSGADGLLEERNAFQGCLVRLEEWIHMNLMKFNEAKSKCLHRGWSDA